MTGDRRRPRRRLAAALLLLAGCHVSGLTPADPPDAGVPADASSAIDVGTGTSPDLAVVDETPSCHLGWIRTSLFTLPSVATSGAASIAWSGSALALTWAEQMTGAWANPTPLRFQTYTRDGRPLGATVDVGNVDHVLVTALASRGRSRTESGSSSSTPRAHRSLPRGGLPPCSIHPAVLQRRRRSATPTTATPSSRLAR